MILRSPLSLVLALASLSCGGASQGLKPIAAPDSQVPCPGGYLVWNLEISDQRAERKDSENVQKLLQDSLARSLPGCQWASGNQGDTPTIRIEVHRFGVEFDGATWDAGAEWTVTARDPSGRTLTEFQADARVSRPNYRGSNNEREVLRSAFEEAVTRTLTGLRNVSSRG
jgi:hypothetical protein